MMWLSAKILPIMALLGMDYIGIFMMFVPVIIVLIQLSRTGTGIQFDPPSGMQSIVNYIRRDGTVIPLIGNRVYSGESFIDIPRLGLIEDLGKDTVFNWGVRRVRLGLENINYTPDPRYFNLTSELYRLGFDNSDDLYNVLNVEHISRPEVKKYYLEYMAHVYQNMIHPPERGSKKLLKNMKEKKSKKKIFFNPFRKKTIVGKKLEDKVSPSVVFRVDSDVDEELQRLGK